MNLIRYYNLSGEWLHLNGGWLGADLGMDPIKKCVQSRVDDVLVTILGSIVNTIGGTYLVFLWLSIIGP